MGGRPSRVRSGYRTPSSCEQSVSNIVSRMRNKETQPIIMSVQRTVCVYHISPNQWRKIASHDGRAMEYMEECRVWLSCLKIFKKNPDGSKGKDITSMHKFLNGLRANLQTVAQLFFDLSSEGIISSLKTRTLGSDCLENAFGEIRAKGGSNHNPSPFQLKCSFRHAAMF